MLDWSVLDSTIGSDHFPITINGLSHQANLQHRNYVFSKADWESFKNHARWKALPLNLNNIPNEIIIETFYEILR